MNQHIIIKQTGLDTIAIPGREVFISWKFVRSMDKAPVSLWWISYGAYNEMILTCDRGFQKLFRRYCPLSYEATCWKRDSSFSFHVKASDIKCISKCRSILKFNILEVKLSGIRTSHPYSHSYWLTWEREVDHYSTENKRKKTQLKKAKGKKNGKKKKTG